MYSFLQTNKHTKNTIFLDIPSEVLPIRPPSAPSYELLSTLSLVTVVNPLSPHRLLRLVLMPMRASQLSLAVLRSVLSTSPLFRTPALPDPRGFYQQVCQHSSGGCSAYPPHVGRNGRRQSEGGLNVLLQRDVRRHERHTPPICHRNVERFDVPRAFKTLHVSRLGQPIGHLNHRATAGG